MKNPTLHVFALQDLHFGTNPKQSLGLPADVLIFALLLV